MSLHPLPWHISLAQTSTPNPAAGARTSTPEPSLAPKLPAPGGSTGLGTRGCHKHTDTHIGISLLAHADRPHALARLPRCLSAHPSRVCTPPGTGTFPHPSLTAPGLHLVSSPKQHLWDNTGTTGQVPPSTLAPPTVHARQAQNLSMRFWGVPSAPCLFKSKALHLRTKGSPLLPSLLSCWLGPALQQHPSAPVPHTE